MQTPQDLKEHEFEKAVFGGYDATAVEDFFEKTVDNYAALYKENAVLKSKLKVLVEKVEEYRSTEDSMRMALLTAQKMGNEIVEEANKKAENIIADARERTERREKEFYDRLKDEERKLREAESATSQFSRKILSLYKNQVDFIKNLSDLVIPQDLEKSMGKIPEYPRGQSAPKKTVPAYEGDALKQSVDSLMERAKSKAAEAGMKAEAEAESVSDPSVKTRSKAEHKKSAKSTKIYDTRDDIARSISESLGDTKTLNINPENDLEDEDEPTTKRPRFDFDDLKFGSKFGDDQ